MESLACCICKIEIMSYDDPSYLLWPAATNVVALHPHQIYQTSFELDRKVPPCTGQKGINSNPLLDHPCRSGNIFAIYKTIAAKKLRRKVIQLLTSFESCLGLIRKC